MKPHLLLLALFIAGTAHADPFAKGSVANGEKLSLKYDCNSCHRGLLGGDGNAIYTRADSIVTDASTLIARMEQCSGAIGKKLTEQEKLDLAAYLNKTFYRFK